MIDQQIKALQAKIARKIELEFLIPQWKAELPQLRHQVMQLRVAMLEEQSDVDRLESGGITTVIHKLTGRIDEKLDKERMEAKTASDEYHSAVSRLERAEEDLKRAEQELADLADSEEQYVQLMTDRIQFLEQQTKNRENEAEAESLRLQLQLERRRKSLREALLESDAAGRAAEKNLSALYSARDWARKDAVVDGWHNVERNKQDYLTQADAQAQIILEEMTDLQAKLAQMGIDPEPHIFIGAYLKAPTAYIVGVVSDHSQLDQINKAINQIEALQKQIDQLNEKLNAALEQIEARISEF